MRRMLTALVVALAAAGVASACINDSELPGHEREFRSSYQKQTPPEQPSQYLPTEAVPIALYGGGGLFLLGAGLVAVRRPFAKG